MIIFLKNLKMKTFMRKSNLILIKKLVVENFLDKEKILNFAVKYILLNQGNVPGYLCLVVKEQVDAIRTK